MPSDHAAHWGVSVNPWKAVKHHPACLADIIGGLRADQPRLNQRWGRHVMSLLSGFAAAES
jgi:hypothetical protein